jgi:CheY-like chemotaxis protein
LDRLSFVTLDLHPERETHGKMAKYKILVVDDDRNIVDLVRLYLERDGYQVLVAYDGLKALKLARQRRPDLIVLDLLLPEVDGLDVCRILQTESKVPIIMLTAKTTEEDKLIGLELGADDYVTKPSALGNWWPGCGPCCAGSARRPLKVLRRCALPTW